MESLNLELFMAGKVKISHQILKTLPSYIPEIVIFLKLKLVVNLKNPYNKIFYCCLLFFLIFPGFFSDPEAT